MFTQIVIGAFPLSEHPAVAGCHVLLIKILQNPTQTYLCTNLQLQETEPLLHLPAAHS